MRTPKHSQCPTQNNSRGDRGTWKPGSEDNAPEHHAGQKGGPLGPQPQGASAGDMEGAVAARKSRAWAMQPYMASASWVENSVGCGGSLKASRCDPPRGLRTSLDLERKWVGESPSTELHRMVHTVNPGIVRFIPLSVQGRSIRANAGFPLKRLVRQGFFICARLRNCCAEWT